MIKLLCVADYSGGGSEHSLQLICDRLWSSCIDSIAIINPCHHKSLHKRCCQFFVKRPLDATKLAQTVETICTCFRNMLLKGQIWRKSYLEYSYMIAGHHSISDELHGRDTSTQHRDVVFRAGPQQLGLGGIHLQMICCHPVADVGNAMI